MLIKNTADSTFSAFSSTRGFFCSPSFVQPENEAEWGSKQENEVCREARQDKATILIVSRRPYRSAEAV